MYSESQPKAAVLTQVQSRNSSVWMKIAAAVLAMQTLATGVHVGYSSAEGWNFDFRFQWNLAAAPGKEGTYKQRRYPTLSKPSRVSSGPEEAPDEGPSGNDI